MTHEFKTPISTILISVKLLHNKHILMSSEQILKYSNIIELETKRIQTQVDKILQIALFDKKDIDFKFEELNLHNIIFDLSHSSELLIEDFNGKIKFELNAPNHLILGDKLHLINVIYSLIDNSLKYCNCKPNIILYTFNEPKKIILGIKDNGIGIHRNEIKKIFTKFYRVPTGNLHNIRGFGLGLYYVKSVIKKHNAEINLNSEPGYGTDIRLTFHLQ